MRKKRKEQIGKVISDKMQKTRVVEIKKKFNHPLYKKNIKRRIKLYAHDENQISKLEDLVKVRATRPLSKLKRWRIIEVMK